MTHTNTGRAQRQRFVDINHDFCDTEVIEEKLCDQAGTTTVCNQATCHIHQLHLECFLLDDGEKLWATRENKQTLLYGP